MAGSSSDDVFVDAVDCESFPAYGSDYVAHVSYYVAGIDYAT